MHVCDDAEKEDDDEEEHGEADGKFEKKTPDRNRGGVRRKFRLQGEKTNRMEKNIKYIDCYSVIFHRTAAGSMPFCSQEAALQAHTLVAPAPPTTPSP